MPPDVMGADGWLAVDAGGELGRLEVVGLPSPFDRRDPEAIARALADEVRSDTEVQGAWAFLWLVDPARVGREVRGELRSLHNEGSLRSLTAAGRDALLPALVFRAKLLAADGDAEGFLAMISLAAREATARGGPTRVGYNLAAPDPSAKMFTALMEAAWVFASRSATSLRACVGTMAAAIERTADEWPGSLCGCLSMLDGLTRQVPVEAAAPVWDALNRLRARRS
jgi:hypothetical protein